MDENLKVKAKEIIQSGISKILRNYTENALLINACFISSSRYATLTNTDGLSTTANIPTNLRLDQEIDFQYTNKDLTEKYKTDVMDVIFKNYVVMSVSVVDAILEDLYELFLGTFELDMSAKDINKKVRGAWVNDNILNYFIAVEKANLKKPDDMNTPFEESFIRYKELRIIRHSLVHSNGNISQKNLETLIKYKDKTPIERKGFAIIDSSIIEGSNVILSINIILLIRKYLHSFLIYIYKSLNNT